VIVGAEDGFSHDISALRARASPVDQPPVDVAVDLPVNQIVKPITPQLQPKILQALYGCTVFSELRTRAQNQNFLKKAGAQPCVEYLPRQRETVLLLSASMRR
jgi:hypothetical protein